jgi:hypothetical protein
MIPLLRSRFPEALTAVGPLVAVVCMLQFVLVQAPASTFLEFIVGSVLAMLGVLLLLAGIDFGILPMGRFIGAELPRLGSLWLIGAIAFALGFATTVAEPDVLVLAGQVAAASDGAAGGQNLVYVMGAGVGLFAALALLRVVWGLSMAVLLAVVYSVMVLLSFFSPPLYVPLAYDAGSVTTGVLTSPVIIALTLGLSSVLGDRSAVSDGFGVLGLGSAGPIIVILILGALLS